jgi:F420-dependent oxidoreductase-like protein
MTWEKTVRRWQEFERMGFESVWLCDHLIQPSRPDGPYFEAWTLLAALAARTERIRIGVLVTSNTFRHPSLLVKEVVTVDHISNGRLELGMGAGWYEPEHEMFGIPFPETKELVERFDEAIRLIDQTLKNDVSSFEGTYYRTKGLRNRPGPLQRPRPPLLIGAFGPKMLRLVAKYADTWNAFGTPAEMAERNQLLDEYCVEIGRDPESLDRSLYHWVPKSDDDPWISEQAFHDVVGPYIEAGMNQFIFDQPKDDQFELFERITAEVLPGLRQLQPRRVKAAATLDRSKWRKPVDKIS